MKINRVLLVFCVFFLTGCSGQETSIRTSGLNSNDTLKKLEKGEPVMEGQEVIPRSQNAAKLDFGLNIDLPQTKTVKEKDTVIFHMNDVAIFEYDEAVLHKDANGVLAKLGDLFLKLPKNSIVKIEAHTDDEAGEQYNLQLTQDRANLLLNHFEGREDLGNISFTAEGVGGKMPIVPNDGNAENHQLNRRIDFVIQVPQG